MLGTSAATTPTYSSLGSSFSGKKGKSFFLETSTMEESYDHKSNTITVAQDGDSSGDNASFGSVNKYESDSEEEMKPPQSRIKRSVSQYVKHIAEKKEAVSPLNVSSSESKSPTDDTDRKIMHALTRYQSHLSQLKEIKVELPPVRAPTPPPQLPPTPPPRPPLRYRDDSPAVSVNIGINSIDFAEASPVLYPTESSAATHIPASLNDTASTLLMTAALNALTQARGAHSAGDPLTTALAAASAQILAAALNKPPAVPPTPPCAPTPPPPPVVVSMNSVSTETDATPPPSPRMAKDFHDRLRLSGMTQVNSQSTSGPPSASYSSSYDRMMANRPGIKPQHLGAGSFDVPPRVQPGRRPSLPPTAGLGKLSQSAKQSPPQRVPPVVPPLAVSGLSASQSTQNGIASVGVTSAREGGRELAVSGKGFVSGPSEPAVDTTPAAPVDTTAKTTTAATSPVPAPVTAAVGTDGSLSARSGSSKRGAWPNLPHINTAPLPNSARSHKSTASAVSNISNSNASSSSAHNLRSSLSTSPTHQSGSDGSPVHRNSLRSVKSLTFDSLIPEPENNLEYGDTNDSDDVCLLFGSETVSSPSFKDFHLKYAKGLLAVEAVRSDSFSPRSAFSVSPRHNAGNSASSVDISELDDNTGNNGSASSSHRNSVHNASNTNTNDDAGSAISDVYSGSSEVYSGTNTYTNNTHTTDNTTHSLTLSPAPHVDSRVMMDTLLNGTDSVATRLRIESEYQAPVNMYSKQFHSVDPRVFEAVYEEPTSPSRGSASTKSPRALYRNSILALISATPGFVNSPRKTPADEYNTDYALNAFNTLNDEEAYFANNSNNSNNNSEYGSYVEDEKSETVSEYNETILSESLESKVSSVYTVHSIPGVADTRAGGCMIHRTVSNTGTPVKVVSKYYNLDTTDTTNVSGKDNMSNKNSMGIADVHVDETDNVSEYSSVESETSDTTPLSTPPTNTLHGKHKSTTSMYTTRTTTATPPPRPASTPHTATSNNNTHRLLHTNSTRSVHRSFKYDESSKVHILGRQTTSIKGQNKLHDTALEFKQDHCLNSIDAKNLKQASVQNRNVLVGWQVLILKKGEMSLLGLAVITGVRTNLLFQTEYRISSDVSLDCWVRLKRQKGMGGTEFQPLRKVLTTKQCSTKMRVMQYKKTI